MSKYPEFAKWLGMKFLEWQFLEWQTDKGKRKTCKEFAAWLGFKNATVNQWLNGGCMPRPDYAFQLSKRFGLEVYEMIGVSSPDRTLWEIMIAWPTMSDARRKELSKVLMKR